MAPSVPIEGGVVGCDVNCLLDPTLEPSAVFVQHINIFLLKLVVRVGQMFAHRGGLSFVFLESFMEISLSFSLYEWSQSWHSIWCITPDWSILLVLSLGWTRWLLMVLVGLECTLIPCFLILLLIASVTPVT